MDQQMNSMGDKPKVCNCPHHKVIPWMIILIGIDFILGSWVPFYAMWTWPVLGILLIIIGGVKLSSRKCGCCK
jgi:hypothetical protein